MQALVANGTDIDGLQQGKTAYIAGDYQAAINAFNDYTTNYQLAAIPAELHLMLGRAYREIGNFDAATVAFRRLLTSIHKTHYLVMHYWNGDVHAFCQVIFRWRLRRIWRLLITITI